MKKRIWLYATIVILLVAFVAVILNRTKFAEGKRKELTEKQQRVKLPEPPVITRSEDDLHVAWAQLKPNGKLVVSIDGKVDSTEYDDVSIIVISPDGERVAYSVRIGSKWFMVVNGKKVEVGDFDGISTAWITFSPDSKRLAFGAERGEKWFVVLDGKIIPPDGHDFVSYFAFSPDSRHFVYVAGKDNKQSVVHDGKAGPFYFLIGKPVFSPDSKHLAYVASYNQDVKCVVLDGKEGKKYGGINIPIFSSDSRNIAYSVREDVNRFVVVDGEEGPKYEMNSTIFQVKFAPDDNRLAYAVVKDEKWMVVIDGQEGASYDAIGEDGASIVFSSDGKSFAYAANIGEKWFVVTNDEEGPEYDGIATGTPIFSPDGKHLFYGAREENRWFAVLDWKEGSRAYDEIGNGVKFSPDSKHILFTAKAEGKWFVVVDDKAGPAYDCIFTPAFKGDGIEYLAEREIDGRLLRISQPYPDNDIDVEAYKAMAEEIELASLPLPSSRSGRSGECKICQRNR
jgi:Tol biopolymer transport system component